jgi:hypothetical protein
MDPTNLPPRSTPHWALYRREKFVEATRDGQEPPFSTHPDELERLAKERLSATGWSYASCNAGLGDTHKSNRDAFKDWKIVPRMGVDTNARDTTTEIFGRKLSVPIGISPVGLNKVRFEAKVSASVSRYQATNLTLPFADLPPRRRASCGTRGGRARNPL